MPCTGRWEGHQSIPAQGRAAGAGNTDVRQLVQSLWMKGTWEWQTPDLM